ncbi:MULTISPECIES: TetR/AcrR family transcriptional regulator [Maribacter]|uniref:DNA-binding transcriptional regulator, AcrR family n=1 Tax=Maribacter dokdonensis TaxID=320912 RepID=A0ABY0UKA1_9FLAO|nr:MULTISPECIES: TetR/AcrR family transcriptional regulator [Maribacter]KSA14467.1 Transcriptional regulator, TetR family [Maribacter dokdonensis DSW-8]MDP2526851.1 TetR/AcrR family transcriptional regulator [Maribacter dokdonensis]PHN93806.1 TetR/AcrR family transcriptional regulator [Maribacter sp. 6B07]CAG2532379.1 TetR family [Maribacter dokdonensis]SDS81358.1 DNA-binding transcriptional regulator, AcrR family [Maribacter dokdonensis]|tara:strand:- start:60 stop:644 length:585 start_codon:yes stop_codon:yes gene_type:complete
MMAKSVKKDLFFKETLKLIHEKGFRATTMRDIAERMNFEVANIYNYIDSKDALLENYVIGITKEFQTYMDNIIDSTFSPKDKLRMVISKHIQFTFEKPYQLALMANEWRNLKEPALSEYVAKRSDYISKIASILEDGVEKGEFRPMNIEIATNSIVSSLRWSYNKYVDNSNTSINPIELEKQFMDFIFNGVKAS